MNSVERRRNKELFSGMIIPHNYFKESDELIQRECNGIGPAGSWLYYIIPKTICNISINHCGDLHDFSYYQGISLKDKCKADRDFLYNILVTLDKNIDLENKELLDIAHRGAWAYFSAVNQFGMYAFMVGKVGSIPKRTIKSLIKTMLREKKSLTSDWDNDNDDVDIRDIKVKVFKKLDMVNTFDYDHI